MVTTVTGRTGEICTVTGEYRSKQCNPIVFADFQRGDRFTPCQNGGDTIWDLIKRK